MHFERSAKVFRHFKDAEVVYELLDEMRRRHGRSYHQIAVEMAEQIGKYFDREFKRSTNPSRFAEADQSVVRERLIVALSGGIDSTVVVFLGKLAVGGRQLLPVTMPARPDDPSTKLAALTRAQLGFNEPGLPYEIDIQPMLETHMRIMHGYGAQMQLGTHYRDQTKEHKMRSGNIGSRARVAVLYDLQRAIRGRILGTSNRTEFCQGYSTKFGTPISYDFGVLDDLYKVDIYELAKVLGVPNAALEADPSTGYFEGQTHEGELGASLEEQDIVSYLLFEKNFSVPEVVSRYGISEKFANTMQHRWDVSGHKRMLNKDQERVRVARYQLSM